MALKDRIQALLDAGFTRTQIAKAAKKSQSAVTQWLSGDTKELKSDSAAGIQAATGFNAVWLATGHGPKMATEATNVAAGPNMGGSVPLLSSVQAGNFKEFVNNFSSADNPIEHVPTSVPVKQFTFALRVEGDSMEPDFKEGMVIIVEPELDPLPNDFVIVKNGNEESTFKQLVKDGSDWYLKPLNDRYPIKLLAPDMRIVGVVRAVEKRFR
ncbi:LexA family protein [Comamonas terrigena]|uniref:LexA family protein n=1 Tax=Comamonas terrigena TaxID=32013 RepID=UPI00244B8DC8|nr:S24 family peptidase [Comamonas terrigena]MDH0049648.1 S24 family peptidase [Comamonas terrigena]MDH0511300.1 S24 family peptidase [Comamonas terrigena]MDH1091397.1 S24 family peptidase [Comamonas terrigena]